MSDCVQVRRSLTVQTGAVRQPGRVSIGTFGTARAILPFSIVAAMSLAFTVSPFAHADEGDPDIPSLSGAAGSAAADNPGNPLSILIESTLTNPAEGTIQPGAYYAINDLWSSDSLAFSNDYLNEVTVVSDAIGDVNGTVQSRQATDGLLR